MAVIHAIKRAKPSGPKMMRADSTISAEPPNMAGPRRRKH